MPRASTGYLKLINGVWHVRLSTGSGASRERPWYSLGTSDKRAAERRRKQLVEQRRAGVDPAKAAAAMPEAITVAEFAATWNEKRKAQGIVSARDDEQRLRDYVLPHIGAKLPGDVLPKDLEAVFDDVVLARRSKETLAHVRAAAGRLFKAAWRAGLVTENPVDKAELPRVREQKRARVILTDNEVVQLLEHLGRSAERGDGWRAENARELRAMCACARILGGMRTSDVNRWDWQQIDLLRFAHVIIPRSKTEAPQDLAVPEDLRPILRDWWMAAGRPTSGPVFPVRRGPRAGEAKVERGISYAKRLRRECQRAGLTRPELYKDTARTRRLDFHGFRRAFASALANAPGVTMQQAMKLAAHADASTHMRYVAEVTEIPAAAVPRLTNGSNQSVGPDWPLASGSGQSIENPSKTARHSGFEPLAFGSGGRRSDGESAPEPPKPASQHTIDHAHGGLRNPGPGSDWPRLASGQVPPVLSELGTSAAAAGVFWDVLDASLEEVDRVLVGGGEGGRR